MPINVPRPTAVSRRIVRLAAKHGVQWPGGESNAYIRRLHAGRHQKASGMLSWVLDSVDGRLDIPSVGGYDPASAVRDDWDFGWDNEYYAFDPPKKARDAH